MLFKHQKTIQFTVHLLFYKINFEYDVKVNCVLFKTVFRMR